MSNGSSASVCEVIINHYKSHNALWHSCTLKTQKSLPPLIKIKHFITQSCFTEEHPYSGFSQILSDLDLKKEEVVKKNLEKI